MMNRTRVATTMTFALLGLLIAASPATAGVWGTSALSELTGSRSVSSNQLVKQGGGSKWNNFTISWNVTQNLNGSWTYVYTYTGAPPDISHTWMEVTAGVVQSELTVNNTVVGPYTYAGTNGGSDPYWPTVNGSKVPIYAFKMDNEIGINGTYTITTERSPVYGNFFSTGGGKSVYNKGFLSWNGSEFTETNKNFFIVRPDGTTPPPPDQPSGIPEPVTATLSLLGLGALATMTQRRPVR
ncbi:MAG: hypothetical protein WD042_12625 [Phycisphaeraceae bacterium]